MLLHLKIAQFGGFIGAQITNSVLHYLIHTRAEKLFGTYRHVMCTFAMYSLVHSWIEILTEPVIHTKGPVFVIVMNGFLKYEKWIGNNITCLYCGSFALCISLLAAQFFYRYIAVCRPQNLKVFGGKKLCMLFIPCIICFILWFLFVYFGMYDTVQKQEFLKHEERKKKKQKKKCELSSSDIFNQRCRNKCGSTSQNDAVKANPNLQMFFFHYHYYA